MSKQKITVYVSWCVCCHSKHTTLYKLTPDGVMICKACRDELIRTGEREIFSGEGILVLPTSRDISRVGYLPYKTEPTKEEVLKCV